MTDLTAKVKWFNRGKHFGFVTLDDGRDALVHQSTLGAWVNVSDLKPGTMVACTVVERDRGLQVQELRVLEVPDTEWIVATIKWFNKAAGFGFFTSAGVDGDIFVHTSTMPGGRAPDTIEPGDRYQILLGQGGNGKHRAERVRS